MLKTITLIFFLSLLNGCVQNAAFLGPVITGASTGSAYQAGLSYGSSIVVTKITGKSPTENIQILLVPNKSKEDDNNTENIKTLLDPNKNKEDNNENANSFFKLVKKVNESNSIKDLANQ
tara:strand:- start:569 stop:928 length:360 start_codon:yes stop_codon:yes gene_type:complete